MAATLRDHELHVAQVLEAAGLGVSMTSSPPSLYVGRFAEPARVQYVAVREVSGEAPLDYIGTGRSWLAPDVQVYVRGEPRKYHEAQALARRCWSVLHQAQVPGYSSCLAQGLPMYMGPDGAEGHRFAFTVTLGYAA
ncbi:hypothetical protein DRW03_21250 [Corallococcus sp. H22C18031201]|nr:hypothetical protein DRW03_21250 [Corallococcus sp. H22C18031201]